MGFFCLHQRQRAKQTGVIAERGCGEGDRNLAVQIHAVAGENLVLLDVNDHIEIAGAAATQARFAAAGLDFAAVLEPGNRQLMVPSACGRARALLVRNADVPVYVAYGQAQLGVVGYDVIREHQLPVAQLLDLGFGGCRMSVAVKATSPYRRAADLPAHCRIASCARCD